ncbi:MAG: hypothetical protein H0U27_08905 [Nitrosopumilus sp.]|nr:hypothetical protein [Nitrosopumilus sp.]
MKTIHLIFGYILFFLSSCQMLPGGDQQYDDNSSNSFKLSLNPVSGSLYHYEIVNSTEVVFEFNGEKIETINKSRVIRK